MAAQCRVVTQLPIELKERSIFRLRDTQGEWRDRAPDPAVNLGGGEAAINEPFTQVPERTAKGQVGKWVVADPMPDGVELLPAPETLEPGCAVVRAPGDDIPPPPLDTGVEAIVDRVAGVAP